MVLANGVTSRQMTEAFIETVGQLEEGVEREFTA